jgi:hypothetical protein
MKYFHGIKILVKCSQVKIEHRHDDTSAPQNGVWTLDVARTLFESEKGDRYSGIFDPPADTGEEITARTEISQEESQKNGYENTLNSEARDEKTEMDNDIPVGEELEKKNYSEFLLPPLGELLIRGEQYGMNSRVQEDVYSTEEQYESDEVILDPDNYEYFKGVSR